MSSRQLLIVWHSRTGAAKAMAEAAFEGARGAGDVRVLRACDADSDDVLGAGGYIFACPENLATMSGEMKEFFDRCYYPVLGKVEGRAFATLIAAGSDGAGAQAQIDRIATGWRLKRVAERLIANTDAQTPDEILAPKTLDEAILKQCREMGQALVTGLEIGAF
ncbi:NAD(P)H-dependent oxidoreductase [Novosphingobium sp. ZN18A2]|uniref:flavodoxin family protein n=1 Tax=Novosphingobium sp. ZN18A2 TaxID=3079861 RepID=UPI0030CE6620